MTSSWYKDHHTLNHRCPVMGGYRIDWNKPRNKGGVVQYVNLGVNMPSSSPLESFPLAFVQTQTSKQFGF